MTHKPNSIADVLLSIVVAARTGDYGGASSLLNTALPLVQETLTSTVLPQAVQNKIAFILGDLLAAQSRKDWVGFADTLEYSLIGLWIESFGYAQMSTT